LSPSRDNVPGLKIRKRGGAVAPKSKKVAPKFKKKFEKEI